MNSPGMCELQSFMSILARDEKAQTLTVMHLALSLSRLAVGGTAFANHAGLDTRD